MVDLSAVAVLLVALVGGTLMGLVGAIMAIPIAATIKVALTPAFADSGPPALQHDDRPRSDGEDGAA